MQKEITLTPEELKELKDEIKFREKVCLHLKQLNGIPKKVWQLQVESKIYGVIIIGIIIGITTMALRVWAK